MNKNALRSISYGVYVISANIDGRSTGCIANSLMQITSEPATIAVSINHDNFTNKAITTSGKFAVSVLTENSNPNIIATFGFSSGKNKNKFDSIDNIVKDGIKVVKDSAGYFVCEVVNSMETDTHTVFLGKIIDCDELSSDTPMSYAFYRNVIKGKSPKNAPTYIVDEVKNKCVCSICGYVYEGKEPFEKISDSYICPVCGALKKLFIKE